MLTSAKGSFDGVFFGLREAGFRLGDSGAPGIEAPANDGLIIGWPYIIGCWGIIGIPSPDKARANPDLLLLPVRWEQLLLMRVPHFLE